MEGGGLPDQTSPRSVPTLGKSKIHMALCLGQRTLYGRCDRCGRGGTNGGTMIFDVFGTAPAQGTKEEQVIYLISQATRWWAIRRIPRQDDPGYWHWENCDLRCHTGGKPGAISGA